MDQDGRGGVWLVGGSSLGRSQFCPRTIENHTATVKIPWENTSPDGALTCLWPCNKQSRLYYRKAPLHLARLDNG